MRDWRLWILLAGVIAVVVALNGDGVGAGGRGPVYGDFNCDSQVDAGDALGLLLKVSEAGASRGASGCQVAGAGFAGGDVNCDGVVDVGDVITLTRSLSGLSGSDATFCPQPGDDVGAPLVKLECSPAGEPMAVRCRYDVYQADHPIQKQFGGADGEVEVILETSSVACDPGQVHCEYGYAAEVVVTFGGPGGRDVSVTACQMEACATRVVRVWV